MPLHGPSHNQNRSVLKRTQNLKNYKGGCTHFLVGTAPKLHPPGFLTMVDSSGGATPFTRVRVDDTIPDPPPPPPRMSKLLGPGAVRGGIVVQDEAHAMLAEGQEACREVPGGKTGLPETYTTVFTRESHSWRKRRPINPT